VEIGMMNSVLDINISHKYLHLFAVILFLVASAIIAPEYEFPDEYHHVTSVLDPGRHLNDPNLDKESWFSYSYIYNKIFSYISDDFEYKDPFLRIKSRNFDSTSFYVQTKKNTTSVIKLRILQLALSIFLVFFVAYLILNHERFNNFVSLFVVYMSWPLVSSSIIGFNPAVILSLFIPLIIILISSRRYLSGFLISYVISYQDNQAVVVMAVTLLIWVVNTWLYQKHQLYVYYNKLISNKKLFVIILLLLAILLHAYSIQIFKFIYSISKVLYSQAGYLNRDLLSTGVIFVFTSLHYNGSLTSFNYYFVYVIYLFLMYKSIGFCIKKNCMRGDFINIVSLAIFTLLFVLFYGQLANMRYYLYVIPFIITVIIIYLEHKEISADYVVYAGLLVSAIGMYKFTSESYALI